MDDGNEDDNDEDGTVPPPILTMAEYAMGIQNCKSTHWDPYVERLQAMKRGCINPFQKRAYRKHNFDNGKYWPYINFIGHMDTAYEDAKTLLTKINAWDTFGKHGWANDDADAGGEYDSFFNTRDFISTEMKYKERTRNIFLNKEEEDGGGGRSAQLEKQVVDKLYKADYNSRWLNLTKK